MIQQNFHHSHIDQLAGGNIYNFGDNAASEQRRAELSRRADWHIQERDLARRGIHWNRYVPIMLILVSGLVFLALHALEGGFQAARAVIPFELAITGAIGTNLWFLGRHRDRCNANWRQHNDALIEINRILAVL